MAVMKRLGVDLVGMKVKKKKSAAGVRHEALWNEVFHMELLEGIGQWVERLRAGATE